MRVFIIGASCNRAKYGNMAVRAYLRAGHEVLPVNPNEPPPLSRDSAPGQRFWMSEGAGPIDRAAMYVPPLLTSALRSSPKGGLAQRGDIGEPPLLWFNPGSETPALLAEAKVLGLHIPPFYGCAILDRGVGQVP